MQEPSIDTDKLSYEIFSILESKFLFGYDDHKTNHDAPIKNQRGKICILTIDAAGMRGILSGKALAYLENALKLKSGDPNATIADYFDVSAGSGVGGIFTSMLFATRDSSRPLFRADDTWRFLVDQGHKFYKSNSKKSSSFLEWFVRAGSGTAGLERTMKEAFKDEKKQRSLTLRDTLKPVLIPCYDLSTTAPLLFSRADALETDSYDFRLFDVCRATSAEPGVFDPVQMKSINNQTRCLGINGVTNPTAAAITHVLHNKQEFPFVRGVEDLLVLSIGSGQFLEPGHEYHHVKKWKAKEWARPVARISGDGSADLVDQSVAMAFAQSGSSNYVRIQANATSLGRCGPNVDTDPSPSNVKMLVGLAEDMLKQKNVESVLFGGKRIGEQSNYEKLDWFAGELVLEHQRRSCRIAPTVAFKQAAPKAG